jgi:hypothetical protein
MIDLLKARGVKHIQVLDGGGFALSNFWGAVHYRGFFWVFEQPQHHKVRLIALFKVLTITPSKESLWVNSPPMT